MTYKEQNFEHLLGMIGFSDTLLKNHFKLYAGYVKNTNKLAEMMQGMIREGKTDTPEFAEVKRRFGWEFNGMRLHELYFGNIGREKKELPTNSNLYKKMLDDFGSGDDCKTDFLAAGSMRGIGWVVLAFDPVGKRLFNVWINEHDAGHLAGAALLLVMDVFEHAFMIDYGLDRKAYIEAFINAVNWEEVSKRFDAASKK